jgi:hypothetical protein
MNNDFIPGVATGVISSLIFNPFDKVVYVSTTKNISIFNKNIWTELYKGSLFTISTKIITSGLYFSYLDYYYQKTNSVVQTSLITSVMCGITSPIQLIKFHSWYNDCSYKNSIRVIYKNFGYKGFFVGMFPLITRDFFFNNIYLSFKSDNHLINIAAVCCGLVVVSPFNLIKNKKYATNESIKSIIKNFKFNQLGIQHSIVRTGLCFYVNQYIYDLCKYYISLYH